MKTRFYSHCLLSLSILYAGFSVSEFYGVQFISDAFAQKKSTRAGKLSGARVAVRRSSSVASTTTPATTAVVTPPPPPVKEFIDDGEIKIPVSTNAFALDKLKRERDDLKRQFNTLQTQKEMQKKSTGSTVGMCTTPAGRQRVSDLEAGVKLQEGRRESVLASFASIEKEITELETFIKENSEKRDKLKGKAEGTSIAAAAVGTAAVVTTAGAAVMVGQNSKLKKEEDKVKQGSGVDTSKLGGSGLSLDSLKGIDPSKLGKLLNGDK